MLASIRDLSSKRTLYKKCFQWKACNNAVLKAGFPRDFWQNVKNGLVRKKRVSSSCQNCISGRYWQRCRQAALPSLSMCLHPDLCQRVSRMHARLPLYGGCVWRLQRGRNCVPGFRIAARLNTVTQRITATGNQSLSEAPGFPCVLPHPSLNQKVL